MSTFWKRSRETVRVEASRKTVALLCLVVFGLTASVTYWRGTQRWTPVDLRPTYTASVEVIERGPKVGLGETPTASANPEDRQSFSLTANTAEQAAAGANALANRHIAERRERWKIESETPYLAARQALTGARQAYADATRQLEAFRHALDAAAQAAAQAKQSEQSTAPEAAMIENPRWRELQNELTALQSRQNQLLVERTSFHPAVQEVVARIESLQEKMIGIPPHIRSSDAETLDLREPAVQATTTAAIGPLKGGDASSQGVTPQDQARLASLAADVERLDRDCKEADLAERLAARTRCGEPAFVVAPTQVVAHAAPPDFGWRRLIATTLATGLIMAAGFGTFAVGASIAPPVVSRSQLEAELDMPILGVVPADVAKVDAAAIHRQKSRLQRKLIGLGMAIMCICPVVAIWGVMGIY